MWFVNVVAYCLHWKDPVLNYFLINWQGHSVTRKLKSDGRVDTRQTLHNLNESMLMLLLLCLALQSLGSG